MGGRLADTLWSTQWLPYVLAGLGLLLGPVVLLLEPIPWPVANLLVGGAFLAVAAGSVAFLIARHSGPGERGPDF
jgi:hypothetical protein